MLFPQFLLVSNDDVKLVLLTPDVGLDSCYFTGKIFATVDLVIESSSIGPRLCLILISLSLYVSKSDLSFVYLIVQRP